MVLRPRLSPFSLKDCCWVEKAWDQQLCGLEGRGAWIACHAVTVRKVWLAEASVFVLVVFVVKHPYTLIG